MTPWMDGPKALYSPCCPASTPNLDCGYNCGYDAVVEFSWDEPKREWVLAERGIDFLRVAFSLFDGRPLLTVPTPRGEEERFLSIGQIEGKFFAVIWMWREEPYA